MAFAAAGLASLVSVGNFEDDLAKLEECDWVIEAVAENLEIKRALLTKVVAAPASYGDPDDEHERAAGGQDC